MRAVGVNELNNLKSHITHVFFPSKFTSFPSSAFFFSRSTASRFCARHHLANLSVSASNLLSARSFINLITGYLIMTFMLELSLVFFFFFLPPPPLTRWSIECIKKYRIKHFPALNLPSRQTGGEKSLFFASCFEAYEVFMCVCETQCLGNEVGLLMKRHLLPAASPGESPPPSTVYNHMSTH